jgi:hypothetical protein
VSEGAHGTSERGRQASNATGELSQQPTELSKQGRVGEKGLLEALEPLNRLRLSPRDLGLAKPTE